MIKKAFSGKAEITTEGIKKHFKRWAKEPFQAIIELVANGFDAKAQSVEVQIKRNDMGGLNAITVNDNGTGINIDECQQHFSRFNESAKHGDDDLQGSHGKGRLAFHLLCEEATWYTRCNNQDAKITIHGTHLRDFNASGIEHNEQHASLTEFNSGTCVSLQRFDQELPEEKSIIGKLQNAFGWRLALNPKRKLFLNGQEIAVPANKKVTKTITIGDYRFDLCFLRWGSKPGEEKSYNYLINKEGRIAYRELSRFNKKPNFYLSTYVESDWIEFFDKHADSLPFNEVTANPNSPEFKTLKKEIAQHSQAIYEDFLREYIDSQIAFYEQNDYFPQNINLSPSESQWRKENTKQFIKDLYFVEPAIFSSLKAKQAKILIALLDQLLVSNENDTLLEVLGNIIDLDEDKLNILSRQIKNSSLDNVISTIEVLQKREAAVHKLKEIMVSHYKSVLETPDLQTIIERNTWLFGNKYTILGAEEDDFQKVAYQLRSHIKGIDTLDDEDFDQDDWTEGLKIEGIRRQPDLFLARRSVAFGNRNQQYFQCTIIEIKKPGIALNEKHLKQIKDYARIVSQHPGFSLDNMRFEFILVGRKISNHDVEIDAALETAEGNNETGLVFKQSNGRIKGYVKTWASIFTEFDLSNHYLLDKLKTKREKLEGKSATDIVQDLQQPCD